MIKHYSTLNWEIDLLEIWYIADKPAKCWKHVEILGNWQQFFLIGRGNSGSVHNTAIGQLLAEIKNKIKNMAAHGYRNWQTFQKFGNSWALGSVEILLSRHCPIWYGYSGRLKWLESLAYINTTVYPITSIPLVAYCTLPAIYLLTGKFIIPEISTLASLWFSSLFLSILLPAY